VTLAATDPANPYGAMLRWPQECDPVGSRRAARSVGAHVVLVDGALAAWSGRGGRQRLTWLPEDDTERARVTAAVEHALAGLLPSRSPRHERTPLLR
jgi:ATP-dependent Lhr-like helicase